MDHQLQIFADKFTPVNKNLIPTGELLPVEGTPFDFRQPMKIGAHISERDKQLKYGLGYDHNWVLNGKAGEMRTAAVLSESGTGRVMEVLTVEPGLQFYSGNFMDSIIKGKSGNVYEFRNGLCLETQHFPDSPNQPDFHLTHFKLYITH